MDKIKLSIIIPWYKKMEEFRLAFSFNAPFLRKDDYEVILVLDENSEEAEVLEFVRVNNDVKWRVVVNDTPHPWRQPSRALNVGIRNALGEFCFVCSPESVMYTNVPAQLLEIASSATNLLSIGTFCRAYARNDGSLWTNSQDNRLPYGSVCFRKESAEQVRGYPESFDRWGGDDDRFREFLIRIGNEMHLCNDAIMLHVEKDNRHAINGTCRATWDVSSVEQNSEDWGRDFNRIAFDWRENKFSSEE